jgi:hypothetical protein
MKSVTLQIIRSGFLNDIFLKSNENYDAVRIYEKNIICSLRMAHRKSDHGNNRYTITKVALFL